MTSAPMKVTEMVRKVNADTPAVNGQTQVEQGNTLRFHIPFVGGNAVLNPKTLVIRGKFFVGVEADPTQPSVFFQREGIHGIFKTMRVMHGDRVIEVIERYSDFASWYTQLQYSGANGTSVHAPSEFTDLGNYVAGAVNTLWPISGQDGISPLNSGTTGHEFSFAPLSAVLGSRSTKAKFPLCVLNPMEPLVIEFDLDPNGTLVNWITSVGTFTLGDCYLNADYDMVGSSLGAELRASLSGIEWDVPGLEKHEHVVLQPAGVKETEVFSAYGGDLPPDIVDTFIVRSNVQAMTRMIHYFKHQGYETSLDTSISERSFLTYPELTRWQYMIENQLVPDRPITAQIYHTNVPTSRWPRAHFGRMWTTSLKTMGKLRLEPECGFQPMFDLVFDYSKKLPGVLQNSPTIHSMTRPYQQTALTAVRGDDGGFFLAYDFTRQHEGATIPGEKWGAGSFRLRDTEFEVILGMNNRLGMTVSTDPVAYNLVVVTLVEYKRRLVIDKLGRLEAYF